jgi:hypothetical protein
VVGLQAEHKQRLRDLAAIIVVALALLWPAFVNGEPFYMVDTPSYLRGADGAVHELTGASSAWSDELQKRFADDAPELKSAPAPQANAEPAVVLKGRSIYYGALLYAAQWLGNFWAVAILQALLCAVAINSTVATSCRAMGRETTHLFTVGVGVALAAFTPMGYFASYLLPDVFGGLGLLAMGHLLFFWQQQSRASRLFWFALLALATLFHTANILLVTLLALAGAAGLAFRLPASKPGLAAIASTIVIGVMGQFAFSWGVEHATGAAPVRPPFLAARIIDDGPGYDYLREHCPKVRFIFCRSVDFRTRESATLLWSDDPHQGIFQALTPAGQRLSADQQNAFLLAVAKERPLELFRSSVDAFIRQLGYFELESFNYTGSNNVYFRRKLPEPFLDHAKQSRAYQQKMPVTFVEWATLASVLASLVLVALTVRAIVRRERKLTPVAAFFLLLVLGILINAAICGAFSTPRGRYQMRLIWVLPLAALAMGRVRIGRSEAPGASAGAAAAA